MELHHKNHHQTYVNSFNDASEKLATAQSKGDIATQISLQPLVNFHGGGHINHTLFWENLAPKAQGGGVPPSGKLESTIKTTFGSMDDFKAEFNKALAGIQGSGWAWLVKDNQTGGIGIKTYAVSLSCIHVYEVSNLPSCRTKILSWANSHLCWVSMHGSTLTSKSCPSRRWPVLLTLHSLQYQNRKAEYFKAIWDVVNWKAVENRLK